MSSLDNFDKLKGELNRIFVEGFDLKEDDFIRTLLLSAKTSKGALRLVRQLKEDGNTLFKQKDFDGALEQYGYAGVVLACCVFEMGEDRKAFSDLAINILLNTTACLSRQREFVKVGQLCSIILDFQPNSVKALYRRAVAAMELGEPKWGYWDLWAAMEVEPKNPEVSKKFEEVKCILAKKKSSNHPQDFTPNGLGIGLPSPKKFESKCQEKESIKNQCQEFELDSATNKRKGEWEVDMSSKLKKGNHDFCAKDDVQVKARGVGTLQEKTELMEEEMEKSDIGASISKTPIQAEPKYRFDNRKRPGSSISITGRDYDLLKKGKSIKFFNPKSGTLMTIQVKATEGDLSGKDASPSEEVKLFCQGDPKENKVENASCVSEMKKVDLDREDSNSTRNEGELVAISSKSKEPGSKEIPSKSSQSSFQFGAKFNNEGRFKLKARLKEKAIQRKPKGPVSKKRNSSTLSSSPCSVVSCRMHAGMKRKLCYAQDSVPRPRKKSPVNSCSSVSLDCYACSSSENCSSELFYGSCTIASHAMVNDRKAG